MKSRALVITQKPVNGIFKYFVEAREHRQSEAATRCAKLYSYVELNKPFNTYLEAKEFGLSKAKELNARFKNVQFTTFYL